MTLANRASARGDSHVLRAVDGVADWIAFDWSVQWSLPEDLSVLRIKGPEVTIEVAREYEVDLPTGKGELVVVGLAFDNG